MELEDLISAVQSFNAGDAFRVRFSLDQWRTFAQYLTVHRVRAGDLLIRQGDSEKAMYLIGQGSLQVFAANSPAGAAASVSAAGKVAILRAGAIIGEPSLFSDVRRTANVEAMTPCVAWALPGTRLDELMQRSPAIALPVLRAAGAVMAVRMYAYMTQQVPTT